MGSPAELVAHLDDWRPAGREAQIGGTGRARRTTRTSRDSGSPSQDMGVIHEGPDLVQCRQLPASTTPASWNTPGLSLTTAPS